MMTKLINWWKGKPEIPSYPNEFIIIDYSPVAKQNGIKDEQNKIIYKYSIDKFGKRILEKYVYSRERVFAFEEINNIPVYDKTETLKETFPVFSKILPSEIKFISK